MFLFDDAILIEGHCIYSRRFCNDVSLTNLESALHHLLIDSFTNTALMEPSTISAYKALFGINGWRLQHQFPKLIIPQPTLYLRKTSLLCQNGVSIWFGRNHYLICYRSKYIHMYISMYFCYDLLYILLLSRSTAQICIILVSVSQHSFHCLH